MLVNRDEAGLYVTERDRSTWVKVLNRNYSQRIGRDELFERDRQREPVPGWHTCELACQRIEGLFGFAPYFSGQEGIDRDISPLVSQQQ